MNENGRQLYILKKSSGHSAGWAKIVLNAVINLFKGMINKTSINWLTFSIQGNNIKLSYIEYLSSNLKVFFFQNVA